MSRRYEQSRKGREAQLLGCSACEKQLERRGGLRGKWKPFQCRAWSGLGGGAFARAHVLSLFQLQVNAVLEIIKVN